MSYRKMMNEETNRAIGIFFELKQKYGIKFAILAYLSPLIISILFVIMWITVSFAIKNYDNNHNFLLDSENKFIIYDNDVSVIDRKLYYEVDFDKNKIIYRIDGEKYKRDFIEKVDKEVYKEIYDIIKSIKSDENNLVEMTTNEKNTFYRNNIFNLYVIKDNQDNLYYIKDIEKTKKLIGLLKRGSAGFFNI